MLSLVSLVMLLCTLLAWKAVDLEVFDQRANEPRQLFRVVEIVGDDAVPRDLVESLP
jgi:hypothetical protein